MIGGLILMYAFVVYFAVVFIILPAIRGRKNEREEVKKNE